MFPCRFTQNLLCHILFIKLKRACFKRNICFENDKITVHIIHRKRNENIMVVFKTRIRRMQTRIWWIQRIRRIQRIQRIRRIWILIRI